MLKQSKLGIWIRKILQLDLRKKNYVSELQEFLTNFRKTHPEWSPSQLKEMAKNNKIAELRDKRF